MPVVREKVQTSFFISKSVIGVIWLNKGNLLLFWLNDYDPDLNALKINYDEMPADKEMSNIHTTQQQIQIYASNLSFITIFHLISPLTDSPFFIEKSH